MVNPSYDAAVLMKSGVLALRRARPEDAEALSIFAARTFWETYAADSKASDMEAYMAAAFSPAIQLKEIADPASPVTLAVHHDALGEPLVGYTHLMDEEHSVRLKRIYIEQRWMGSGLGQLLIDEARRECGRRGRNRLWLAVWERNPRAIAFYRKMGFRVSGESIFQLGDDIQTDFVMEIGALD